MRHCPVEVGVAGGEVGGNVGVIVVDVGGIGVDVGETGVGVGIPNKLHPNSSSRVNPIHQIFCIRSLSFIRTSSKYWLATSGLTHSVQRFGRDCAGLGSVYFIRRRRAY